MCTRLDHSLGTEGPGFYRDLMCNPHKAEASSWAFCHIHRKLVDAHSMCEYCLLSFATDNKSNLETYQSLLGKLGVDNGDTGSRLSFSLGNATEASIIREDTFCPCCSSLLKMKSCPLPMVLQDIVSAIDTEENSIHASRRIDEINYVTYSELKTSDSESEPWQHGGVDDAVDDLKEEFTLSSIHKQRLHVPFLQVEKSEEVWHSALSSIKELTVADKPAETSTTANERKAEFTDRTTRKNSFRAHEDLKLLLPQVSPNEVISSPGVVTKKTHLMSQTVRTMNTKMLKKMQKCPF
ncbi:hypothetical protein ABZP36_020367 [Zizania latifolia]